MSGTPSKTDLRRRLAEQIALKRAVRTGESRKIERKAQEAMQKIAADPRVTRHMVEAYMATINAHPDAKVPSPIDILDEPAKYRELYDGIVFSLMEKCKAAGIADAETVRGVVDNAYTRYLSLVLGIPAVPF